MKGGFMFVEFIVNHDKKLRKVETNLCHVPVILERLQEKYNSNDIVIFNIYK